MYELATGKRPFAGYSPVASAYKPVQEPPRPPSQINPAIPAAYETITLKLMAKDPDDRYATADLLRTDLRRFMQGQRIEATAPPIAPQAPIPTVAERRAPVVVEPTATGRRTGWFVAILLLLLAVLAGLLFAFAQTLGLTGSEDMVKVPVLSLLHISEPTRPY